MTIKPEVLDALLAAGATAEMIVAAVKADLASEAERVERKRANNAERQRRFKAKNKQVTEDNAGNALPGVTPSLSRPLSPQPPLTPTHTHPEYNTRARKGPVPAKPEGVSSQTWADFLALRKQKRADLSQTALAGIEREAVKAGWSLESALAECVARGWQAFKADWVEGKGAGPPGNSGSLVSGFLTTRKSQTA